MKRIFFPLILVFLLTACAPDQPLPSNPSGTQPAVETLLIAATNTPTITATKKIFPAKTSTPTTNIENTPNITLTYTPIPTITPNSSFTSHSWTANHVLVYYDACGGDSGDIVPITPSLVIYADGQLFTYLWGYDGLHYYPYLVTAQLKQQEICALLNTIDQVGFFEYDPSTYEFDRFGRQIEFYPSEGGSQSTIQINAWQSNTFSGYSPGYFIEYEEEFLDWPKDEATQPPTILPPLRNTFLVIGDYTPDSLTIYQPDALELWMFPASNSDDAHPWPENLPPLKELFENAEELGFSDGKKIRVEGETWLQLSQIFDYLPIEADFSAGDITLEVYIIPLLPYPYPTGITPYCQNPEFFDEDAPFPPTTLTCQPSDGLLAIPSP